MIVQMRPIGSIRPYENNPRNNDGAVEAVIRSIREYGWRQPIVVDSDGIIIVGHTRHKAAIAMGMQEVPVHVAADLPADKARAYRIADNRVGEIAEWEPQALSSELAALEALGVEMEALGWEPDDLREAMHPEGDEIIEDEAPAPLPDAVSRRGDVWIMWNHRLICGDCTSPQDADAVIGGDKCSVCLTDPPYGCGEAYVSHDDTQEALGTLAEAFFVIARDRCEVVAFTPGIQNIRHYPPSDWMLCWFYGVGTGRTPWGFSCWQPLLVYGKDPMLANGKGCHPDGVNKLMSRNDAEQNKATGHACPKPLSVWCWFLDRVSHTCEDVVYEPFSGSGTTIIACEQLGRKCRAIEIEPRYVDVAIRRWQKLTGAQATLDGTNKTWAAIAKKRGVKIDEPDSGTAPNG